jgi:hypothetical protein
VYQLEVMDIRCGQTRRPGDAMDHGGVQLGAICYEFKSAAEYAFKMLEKKDIISGWSRNANMCHESFSSCSLRACRACLHATTESGIAT